MLLMFGMLLKFLLIFHDGNIIWLWYDMIINGNRDGFNTLKYSPSSGWLEISKLFIKIQHFFIIFVIQNLDKNNFINLLFLFELI